MSSPLEKRLNECDQKIDALFQGVELNAEFERQLRALKAYYHRLYLDGVDNDAEEECIETYELLVEGLVGVKNGSLKPEEVLKEVEEIKSLRKAGIVLENIFTSVELLFWAVLSGAFFSYCVCMASPLVAVNPFFALALLSIVCMAAISATVNFFNSMDEFKSLEPVEDEFQREKNLILFFKILPPNPVMLSNAPGNDEPHKEEQRLYPVLN